jgi:hypothetical protein
MLLFIASLQNTGGATNLTPGVGTLAITGFAPTVAQTANQALTPSAGTLTLTGFAPTVAQGAAQAVTPDAGLLAFTGYAPTLTQSANQALTPSTGTLTFTGFAPAVAQSANQALSPNVGAVVLTGYAPTVEQAGSLSLTPDAGSLALTGYAPNVAQTSGATKVGGDDVPRAEIWTTRKAKAVRKRIARELVELKAAAPDLVAGLAVPALQPDWSAYVAQLQAVAAELEVLQARRWEEWLEEDDEDILLLL